MKPETYIEYSKVFDIFSNEKLFPQNIKFIKQVSQILKAGNSVADVGGGTGYFTSKLLDFSPEISLNFIEPSKEMFLSAKERLPKNTNFFNNTIDEVLEDINNQDLFIFQRSLYSFYNSIEKYQKLFDKLYEKLNSNGSIAIFAIAGLYDIDLMKRYLTANFHKVGLTPEEFHEKWKIMEKVFKDFNRTVNGGEFTIFNKNNLGKLAKKSNFEIYFNEGTTFFLRKKI